MTTKFEYLLNAMENAAAQDSPSAHGYAGKRQMVLQYVADLEARVEYPSSPQVKRCPICDWPIVPKGEAGCWEGNCSYRPHEGTAEYERIQNRRRIVGSEVKPRTGDKQDFCPEIRMNSVCCGRYNENGVCQKCGITRDEPRTGEGS